MADLDSIECKHNYQLLDVEKAVFPSRWANTFIRTTRLFCTNCGDIKEKTDIIQAGINEERPTWTYNIKTQ